MVVGRESLVVDPTASEGHDQRRGRKGRKESNVFLSGLRGLCVVRRRLLGHAPRREGKLNRCGFLLYSSSGSPLSPRHAPDPRTSGPTPFKDRCCRSRSRDGSSRSSIKKSKTSCPR